MKRGRRALLILLGCGLVACVAWVLWPGEREPEYQGKKLSEWLEQGYLAATDRSPQAQEATFVIRQMGTNTFSYLLRVAFFEDSVAKRIMAIGAAVPVRPVRVFLQTLGKGTGERDAAIAQFGFRALGPVARPVVPELAKRLNGTNAPNIRSAAMEALARIGKDGLLPLLAAFHDQRYPDRTEVAWMIINVYRRANEPALALQFWIGCLNDNDPNVVRGALALRPSDPDAAVPALAEATRHPNGATRELVIKSLRRFGRSARPAVSALASCLSDPEERVRNAATNALMEIAPEVLTNGVAK